MKVSLNIENDKELRAYIKDLIKGQVFSIAREEIMNILKEALKDKVPTVDPDKILKDKIQDIVKEHLGSNTYYAPSKVKEMAREEIQKIVKDLFANKNPLT